MMLNLQNSHYHKGAKETFIVQKGKIVVARIIDDKLDVTVVNEN